MKQNTDEQSRVFTSRLDVLIPDLMRLFMYIIKEHVQKYPYKATQRAVRGRGASTE